MMQHFSGELQCSVVHLIIVINYVNSTLKNILCVSVYFSIYIQEMDGWIYTSRKWMDVNPQSWDIADLHWGM